MADYTLYADNDKKQVSGSAITATSTVVDGGTSFALGTSVPTSPLTAQVQVGGRAAVHGSQVVQSKDLFGAFHSSTVAITSVATNGGSPAKCRFTLVGHVLAVGDVINVTGSTSGNVDGPQKVTAVTATTFDTDKAFVASATAGSYTTVAGNFATLTAEQYVMKAYSTSVAGGQATVVGFGTEGTRNSIHKLLALRSNLVATAIRAGYWDEFSGSWSTTPTAQNDFSTLGTDHAATPTLAVPGELTYRVSGQPDGTNGVTQDDYEAKTG